MILEKTIKTASQFLKSHNISSHELDAQIILSNILGVTREFLITNDHLNITTKINKKFERAIKRRVKKEPVAYRGPYEYSVPDAEEDFIPQNKN